MLSSYVKLNDDKANPNNYDLVLVSEYENMEGLDAYTVHPVTKKVGEFIGKVRLARACIDFEI